MIIQRTSKRGRTHLTRAEPAPPVSHTATITPYPFLDRSLPQCSRPPILLWPRQPAGTDAARQLVAAPPARRRSLPPPSTTSIATQ